MNELVYRLDVWLQAKNKKYYQELLPGLTDEELDLLEENLNVNLPIDFRDLYRWRNGHPSNESFAVPYWGWMNTEAVMSASQNLTTQLKSNRFNQANWWDPNWIPFLSSSGQDFYCLDVLGSFNGKPGQILLYRNDYFNRTIEYESFHNWLKTTVGALETGIYSFNIEDIVVDDEYYSFVVQNNPGYPIEKFAG